MPDPTDQLETAWEQIDRLKAELQEAYMDAGGERLGHLEEVGPLRVENDKLRRLLAKSGQPCAYCNLPADEITKCASGFPGCARMDDITAAVQSKAEQEAEDRAKRYLEQGTALRAEVERLKIERDAALAALWYAGRNFHGVDAPVLATDMLAGKALRAWLDLGGDVPERRARIADNIRAAAGLAPDSGTPAEPQP